MPSAILIRADALHRGFALLHEIGHVLDYAALGTSLDFGTLGDLPLLADWRRVYKASNGYQRLRAAITRVINALHSDQVEERRRLAQLLEPDEVWARGYAQYVATQSGNVELMAVLIAARTPEPGRESHVLQWDDSDFRTIAAVIDALFERLSWRSTTWN
jgi:hypothetical protein